MTLARTYNVTVEAGSETRINVLGTFFYVLDVTAGATIEVGIDESSSIFAAEGVGYEVGAGQDSFKGLRVINKGGAAATVKLVAGFGTFFDNRLNVANQIDTIETLPNTLSTAADQAIVTATATQVLAANGNRVEAIINNLDEDVSIRVGDSNVGASRGIYVPPSGSITLITTAAVHVYHAKGSNLNVAVNESERS